jgi:hypothetical protein
MNPSSVPLPERLSAYGCSRVVMLDSDEPTAELVEYLDLLPRRGTSRQPLPVHAVVEHQGATLLYIVDASDGSDSPASLPNLQRQLANRSDPAWLGVVRPGSLDIYPIEFGVTDASPKPIRSIQSEDERAPLFFQSLVHGTFLEGKKKPQGSDFVFRRIYELLTHTSEAFVPNKVLEPLAVLSVCGRALFFRFLIDRRIVLEEELADICPAATGLKDAFYSTKNAAATSAWLDATFNGDFLPLIDESIPSADRVRREQAYLTLFDSLRERTDAKIFLHLQAILNGWKLVDSTVQMELDWGELNFAHIPIGVLSQVYESFSHLDDPDEARRTSVHYTPRVIARLMVEEVFAAVKDKANAQVLDPACGAGIFLVLAFRRLVHERWLSEKKRPDTRLIQSILYGQLRGFDLSEPALRLAALGLYITAIELNGSPRPPKLLKFPRNLGGEVLHLFNAQEQTRDASGHPLPPFQLGSLGPRVPVGFDKRFDIVIGNPPWTRLREQETQSTTPKKESRKQKKSKTVTDLQSDAFTAIGQSALKARGLASLAATFKNPDKAPDLSFLWRATQWAKDDGLIALALPARLFLHATERGSEPWQAVLKAVSITGLINGADLRWSRVWEGVKVPFCLLFAKNRRAPAGHRFVYLTPWNEPGINKEGRFRIDYESAQPVSAERVARQPWLLKTLSLGTWRDVELMETIKRVFPKTLKERWREWDLKGRKTGQGVNSSADLIQTPADFLGKLKHFKPAGNAFGIPYETLVTYEQTFGFPRAQRPRTEALYQPPLVLLTEARNPERHRPQAYLSDQPLTFSTSYYGYSCAGHPHDQTLAALLYLLPQSLLFDYFCLMTSVGTGADRQTLNKEEFDALPFPDIAALPEQTRDEIRLLAHRLQTEATKPWDKVDAAIFRLYGMDEDAVQTAKDTLYSAAAYRKHGQSALQVTNAKIRAAFAAALSRHLAPFFEVCGELVTVAEPAGWEQDVWREPWVFVAISRTGIDVPVNQALMRRAMLEANKRGASRIIVHSRGKTGVLLGLLNQGRCWTPTRALLCAQHLIRHALGAFGLPETET